MITGCSVKNCKLFRWEDNCKTETTEDENPLQVRNVDILDGIRYRSPVLKTSCNCFIFIMFVLNKNYEDQPLVLKQEQV